MEGTDDKLNPLPPYSTPLPPSQAHHGVPPEAAHGLPNAPGAYNQSWCPYQPSLPPLKYPAIPNRQLPQLPHEGPYDRPNNLPGPSHILTESHPPTFPHINRAPHYSIPPSAPPHPAPHLLPQLTAPEFRPQTIYPSQDHSSNGNPPSPPAQSSTTISHISRTPAHQHLTFGIHQSKAHRAQQACDRCRARKAKCDEGRPSCGHCKENNLICVYKEVLPHKQEKATQQILDKIQCLEDKLDERLTHFQTVQTEQGTQLSMISNEVGMKETKMLAVKDAAQSLPPKQTLDGLVESNAAVFLLESKSKNGAGMQQLDSDEPPGQSYLEREDGELSMPVEHTTAAHKLLSWPSIRNLLYPREYDEDYVMKLEEQRGLIRIYGRGEGDDM
ncbi:hypothetical protein KXV31_006326, partial [Aspergillus fumigatus]